MQRSFFRTSTSLLLLLLLVMQAMGGLVQHQHDQVFSGRGALALRSHDCGDRERHEALGSLVHCALCQRGGTAALPTCQESLAIAAPPEATILYADVVPFPAPRRSLPSLRGPPSTLPS